MIDNGEKNKNQSQIIFDSPIYKYPKNQSERINLSNLMKNQQFLSQKQESQFSNNQQGGLLSSINKKINL